MNFFNNYPIINYNNKLSRNIILKSSIITNIINRVDAFYPYIIKDYERADQIAFDQYDDETLDWVVYLSNNIIDPYYQWPLTDEQLKDYLEKKYNKSIYELQSEIAYYEYRGITGEDPEDIARITWTISPETHSYNTLYTSSEITNEQRVVLTTEYIEGLATEEYTILEDRNAGWYPVYRYDHEYAMNEKRRSIRLLDRFYIPQIKREISTIFSA